MMRLANLNAVIFLLLQKPLRNFNQMVTCCYCSVPLSFVSQPRFAFSRACVMQRDVHRRTSNRVLWHRRNWHSPLAPNTLVCLKPANLTILQ